MEAEAAGADQDRLLALLGHKRSRLGMFEGEVDQGELEIGQAVGAVTAIRPAGQIIEEMMEGCKAALERLAQLAQ